MSCRVCKSLVLLHCLRVTRHALSIAGSPWVQLANLNGANVVVQWGREGIQLAGEILSSAQRLQDKMEGSTAPDHVFATVCFSVAFLVLCKLVIFKHHGVHLRGPKPGLVTNMEGSLSKMARGPDHVPAKCARLIKILINFGKKKVAEMIHKEDHKCTASCGPGSCEPPIHPVIYQPLTPSDSIAMDYLQPQPDTYMPMSEPDVGLDSIMQSDFMLDTDFWSSFMENLTTDGPDVSQSPTL